MKWIEHFIVRKYLNEPLYEWEIEQSPTGHHFRWLKGQNSDLPSTTANIYRSNKKKLEKGYRGKNRIPGRSKKIENGKK